MSAPPLERVARFGNTVVVRGRGVAPAPRAYSLREHVIEEIFKNPAPNWKLIAGKLVEISQALPRSFATAVLLGNAQLRLERREEAIAAYARALHAAPPGDMLRRTLERQLARLRNGESMTTLQPLRSALLE